jgi:hypothetical protein
MYWYRVYAYNASASSGYSNMASAPTLPPAPAALTATGVSASQINLNWSDVSGETGYRLERSLDGVSGWATVANLGANVTSYQNTGLSGGTKYYYRVFATDASGSSAASLTANATTQTPPVTAASATFMRLDTSTEGNWKNVYGLNGYSIVNDSSSYPAYAQISLSGQSSYTWASSTQEVRAPQKSASLDRIAATWYSGTSFTIDVNLTDGQAHQVAVYALDWDNQSRGQKVEIIDPASGAVLNAQTLSAFQSGKYLVWSLKGHVQIRVTRTGGPNAVISGLMFDGVAAQGVSASLVKLDTTTLGSWKSSYGANGYSVVSSTSSFPAYAQVSVTGQQAYTWAASTQETRALQKPGAATDRIAACWYSAGAFTIDVNLTDGQAHQVALYAVDWDGLSRAERVDVVNVATGAILDTQNLSSFQNGKYLVWRISGHVQFRVTRTGSDNAVVSGIFFDPAPAGAEADVLPQFSDNAIEPDTGTTQPAPWYDLDNADAEKLSQDWEWLQELLD